MWLCGFTQNCQLSEAFHINLFTLYTSKLSETVGCHLPSIHCYPDDTQLYLAFSPNTPDDTDVAVQAIRDYIADLRNWMINDQLLLKNKTEFLLLGTRQQLTKVDIEWQSMMSRCHDSIFFSSKQTGLSTMADPRVV